MSPDDPPEERQPWQPPTPPASPGSSNGWAQHPERVWSAGGTADGWPVNPGGSDGASGATAVDWPAPSPERDPAAPAPGTEGSGEHDSSGLPAWPWWSPIVALIMALAGTLAIGVVAGAIIELGGVSIAPDGKPRPEVLIGGTYIQDFALIAAVWVMARLTAGPPSAADLGLRTVAWRKAAGWTVLTWFAFIAISAAYTQLLGIEEQRDNLPQQLGADDSLAALIAVLVLVTILAPIAEEIFFRGFCFTALRRKWGVAVAAILTGAIFGAIHTGGPPPEFLPILAILGALMCLLYWKTGSLIAPMVLHALNNSLALGVSLEWDAAAVIATMIGSSLIVTVFVVIVADRSAARRAQAST